MTPLDRVPDQRPVPAGTGLTLEDALPAPVTAEADGVSARPRLARTVAEMRSLVTELGFDPDTVRQTTDRHWTWECPC